MKFQDTKSSLIFASFLPFLLVSFGNGLIFGKRETTSERHLLLHGFNQTMELATSITKEIIVHVFAVVAFILFIAIALFFRVKRYGLTQTIKSEVENQKQLFHFVLATAKLLAAFFIIFLLFALGNVAYLLLTH